MNTRTASTLTLSALAMAASLLVQTSALAAASAEDLGKIKLYGDVTIAQDSTDQWGPWEQFEPPSAGPVSLSQLKFGSELYRPLAQSSLQAATPFVIPDCAGGRLCGIGFFTDSTEFSDEAQGLVNHAFMTVGPEKSTGSSNAPTGIYGRSLTLQTTALTTGSVVFPESGKLDMLYKPMPLDLNGLDGQDAQEALAAQEAQYTQNKYAYERSVSDSVSGAGVSLELSPLPADVGAKETPEDTRFMHMRMLRYINATKTAELKILENSDFVGAIGYATSDSDMTTLRTIGAKATYRDQDSTWIMKVDFGNSTANTVLDGKYTAQQVITGRVVNSTSVTGGGALAGSSIGAVFHGSMASSAAGIAQIVTTSGTSYHIGSMTKMPAEQPR